MARAGRTVGLQTGEAGADGGVRHGAEVEPQLAVGERAVQVPIRSAILPLLGEAVTNGQSGPVNAHRVAQQLARAGPEHDQIRRRDRPQSAWRVLRRTAGERYRPAYPISSKRAQADGSPFDSRCCRYARRGRAAVEEGRRPRRPSARGEQRSHRTATRSGKLGDESTSRGAWLSNRRPRLGAGVAGMDGERPQQRAARAAERTASTDRWRERAGKKAGDRRETACPSRAAARVERRARRLDTLAAIV